MPTAAKIYLLLGTGLCTCLFAFTSPVLHVYFMGRVAPRVVAWADLLSTGLAFLINASVQSDKALALYRRYFKLIVAVDVVCFGVVSFYSSECIKLRFLGFAVLNAVSGNLWVILMHNAVNNLIKGNALTKWDALSKGVGVAGSFIGALLAIWCSNMAVELCIGLQCLGNCLGGLADGKAWDLLTATVAPNQRTVKHRRRRKKAHHRKARHR